MLTQVFPALFGTKSMRMTQSIRQVSPQISLETLCLGRSGDSQWVPFVCHTDDHDSVRSEDAHTDTFIISPLKFEGPILFLSSVPKISLARQHIYW